MIQYHSCINYKTLARSHFPQLRLSRLITSAARFFLHARTRVCMEQAKSVLSTSHAYLDNTRVSNPGQVVAAVRLQLFEIMQISRL